MIDEVELDGLWRHHAAAHAALHLAEKAIAGADWRQAARHLFTAVNYCNEANRSAVTLLAAEREKERP